MKEYPGSPELGDIVLEIKATGGMTLGYMLAKTISDPDFTKLTKEDVEGYPEFWKQLS